VGLHDLLESELYRLTLLEFRRALNSLVKNIRFEIVNFYIQGLKEESVNKRMRNRERWPHQIPNCCKGNGVCVAAKTTVAAPSSLNINRDSVGLTERPISTCRDKKSHPLLERPCLWILTGYTRENFSLVKADQNCPESGLWIWSGYHAFVCRY
jgi:hypothetical protein